MPTNKTIVLLLKVNPKNYPSRVIEKNMKFTLSFWISLNKKKKKKRLRHLSFIPLFRFEYSYYDKTAASRTLSNRSVCTYLYSIFVRTLTLYTAHRVRLPYNTVNPVPTRKSPSSGGAKLYAYPSPTPKHRPH